MGRVPTRPSCFSGPRIGGHRLQITIPVRRQYLEIKRHRPDLIVTFRLAHFHGAIHMHAEVGRRPQDSGSVNFDRDTDLLHLSPDYRLS
jgi:hypothetical protein